MEKTSFFSNVQFENGIYQLNWLAFQTEHFRLKDVEKMYELQLKNNATTTFNGPVCGFPSISMLHILYFKSVYFIPNKMLVTWLWLLFGSIIVCSSNWYAFCNDFIYASLLCMNECLVISYVWVSFPSWLLQSVDFSSLFILVMSKRRIKYMFSFAEKMKRNVW